jgi:hypothetical protein
MIPGYQVYSGVKKFGAHFLRSGNLRRKFPNRKKPGFPLQVLGFANANPVGFPLQSPCAAQGQHKIAHAILPYRIA